VRALNDGTVKIGTELDQTGFKTGLNGLESSASKGFGGVGKVASAMATATVAALAAVGAGMGAAATVGLKYNSQMENYMASFTTMLGDESTALQKVEELKKLAAATPYEMGDLADGTKTLLAFGIANKDTTADLTMLGDISLGNVEKLKSLTMAFGKASSQGKMTGENLQMMIEAGFNPLKIISETTGESISDLTDRMSKGGISADEMAGAFKVATSEGGQFYKGMEIASKTTDGLISTLKDNANAFLGKVMEPISKAIKDVLIPAALSAVDKLTTAFTKDGIPGMIGAVKQLVPVLAPVIGFFEWVVDNGKSIATVLGIITAAVLAYKTAVLAQLVVQELSNAAAAVGAIVTGLLTGAKTVEVGVTGSATAAQWLLNAAMAANPAGIVIAAIAALVAGLVIFSMQTSDATKATEDLLDESKDLVKSCDDAAEAFADQSAEIDTNAAVTQKLSDELYALSGKENKSNTEKARMTELVALLNKQMPELNLTIDAQTGALNKSKTAVDDLIKSKLQEIKLQASEEELLRLYKEQVTIAGERKKAQEALTTAEAAYKKAQADGAFLLGDYGKAVYAARDAVNLLATAQTENVSSITDQETAVGSLTVAVDKMADGADESARVIDDINKGANTNLALSAEETKKILDQKKKNLDEYNAAWIKAADTARSQMGGIEDKGIEKSKLTAAQVKINLEAQIKDWQNWQAGIKALAAKVPEDVMFELRALGPGSDLIIDDLNKMTNKQLAAWIATWRTSAKLVTAAAVEGTAGLPGAIEMAAAAAIEALSDLPGEMYTYGANAGQGFVNGIYSKTTAARLAAEALARATRGATSQVRFNSLPAYALGTDYVPRTGLALLHKGEAVIPADLVRSAQGVTFASMVSSMQGQAYGRSVPNETTALRAFMPNFANPPLRSVSKGPENIVIPVYIGNGLIEEIVVNAADNYAIKKNR